jgi:uncharacterized membrane protein
MTTPATASRTEVLAMNREPGVAARWPKAPGLLMGMGLGGFVDGIILHQILQWHHLLTDQGDFPIDTLHGLEGNTMADGLFHAATWVCVLAGMIVTMHAWQEGKLAPPWRSHLGMLLVGWGAFNVVEGLIDHQLLGIHHVRDDLGGPLAWDIGFLVFGALLVGLGVALSRPGEGSPGRAARPHRAGLSRDRAVK